MGNTVQGRELTWGFYKAATFGEVTGVTAGEKLYYRNAPVTGTRELLRDETRAGFRGRNKPIQGNNNVQGTIPFNMAPESCHPYLQFLIGAGTTYRPTTRDTSTITGVTVNRAEKASATGQGTLSFTATGTTLAWTENGDTAGTAVDVSGGGDFEINSGNGNTLYVTVDAGSLPGTDETDNVTVVDAYEHVFLPADGIPEVGFILEKNYGSKIAVAKRFEHFVGCMFNQGTFELTPSGFLACNADVMGVKVLRDQGAALDSALDDFGHSAFSMFKAAITEGGTSIGTVTGLNLTINNNLDADTFVIGGGGSRASLDPGMLDATGQLTALFQDHSLTDKADDLTETSLDLEWTNGTGDGTAGNEYASIEVDDLVYSFQTPPDDGPNGIRQQLNFEAFRQTGAELGLRAIVRNQRSTINVS